MVTDWLKEGERINMILIVHNYIMCALHGKWFIFIITFLFGREGQKMMHYIRTPTL